MTAQSPHTRTRAAARVERARAIIRRTLGAALAAKASDDLCLALTGPAPTTLGPVFEFEHERLAAVPPAARRATIDALRRDFERSSAAVVTELLRARPRAVIETCWLNSTLQAPAAASLLAELAHDPQLRRVDVPRRLRLHVGSPPKDVVLTGSAVVRELHGLTGCGVVVGVIDTEIMQSHKALGGRVLQAADLSGEGFGRPDFHGTAVAGTLAADGSLLPLSAGASRRFQGVAPKVTIRNYKLEDDASDLHGAQAIERAVEDGLRIVNCSWGIKSAPLTGRSRVARACDSAWSLGTAVVKSAGELGRLTSPADAEGVIVVGAANLLGTAMQNRPPHGVIGARGRPDLVAPGDGDPPPWSTRTDGGIGAVSGGTSIAAPHVSGLLALLLEREPELAPDELRARLLSACTPIGGVPALHQGHGIVSPQRLFDG